jgi:PHS family inorganic phosphate transporter-like MFS transporter
MYGTELIVMIVATLGLTLGTSGQSIGVVGVTIFWRVILGIGIGGDYPNSSVLVSEFATVRWRGAMMAAMFASQGFGAFAASFTSFICITGFQSSLHVRDCGVDCRLSLDKAWRIVYGIGILPAVVALFFRLTIPETIRYTLDIVRNESTAAKDAVGFMDGVHLEDSSTLLDVQVRYTHGFQAPPKASLRDFKRYFGLWKNGKVLLGTASSWFLLDVAFVRLSIAALTIVRNRFEYFPHPPHYRIQPRRKRYSLSRVPPPIMS